MSDMTRGQVCVNQIIGGADVGQIQYDVINSLCPLDNKIDPDENFLLSSYKPTRYWLSSEFNNYIKKSKFDNKNFSILHLNARSLNNKLDDVTHFVQTLAIKFTCIVVSETWFDSDSVMVDLPGYTCFAVNRTSKAGGGIAIYVDSSLCFTSRNDLTLEKFDCDIDIACVQLNIVNTKVLVVGLYRPPNTSIPTFTNHYSSFLENLDREKCNYYIAGDFNIDLLHCENNEPTNAFLNVSLSHFTYPSIAKPTRITETSSTVIDNIFVNSSLNDYFAGILISDLSDHLPIFYVSPDLCSPNVKSSTDTIYYRDINNKSLCEFSLKLSQTNWDQIITKPEVNDAYAEFINYFREIYNSNFPVKHRKCKQRATFKPWFTKGILKSIRKKDVLYKISLKRPSTIPKYKLFKNKLTQTIRAAKKLYYQNLFLDIKYDLKKTWNVIKSIISNGNIKNDAPKEILIDGTSVTDPIVMANKFNEYFVNIGKNLAGKIPNCEGNIGKYVLENLNASSMMIEPTDPNEIINIIKGFSNNKAAGYDDVLTRIIKTVSYSLATPLVSLFNLSFETGIFPDQLKIAKVIPLFKSDDKRMINNYRPISILPVFSKIIEKLMHRRLKNFLDKNNVLTSSQFGFRRGHSTELAIINMIDKVTEAVDKKIECVGVFLDLSKAFDTIDHDILLQKLNLLGVRGVVNNWFGSYLSNRQQFVEISHKRSTLMRISCGVPQGSILGPLLFILYVNDLVNATKDCNVIMFADDTNLFFSSKNLTDLEKTINRELQNICLWFNLNKLSLNVKKTNFILFGHSKRKKPMNICINDFKIDRTDKTKFLGVIINQTLTWSDHITVVTHKVNKSIGIISRLSKTLPSPVLVSLYQSLVAPYYDYCNIAWAINNSVLLVHLYKTQKRAVRIITNSSFNSHTKPLFIKLNVLPIMSLNRLRVGCFMFRALHSLLPNYFNSMFVLNSDVHPHFTRHQSDLHINPCRLNIRKFTLKVYGPTLWNSVPSHIKASETLTQFSKSFKYHLLTTL